MKYHWQNWTLAIIGLYVFSSPWVIPYFSPESSIGEMAQWGHYIIGAALVIVSLVVLASDQVWEEYVLGLLGLLLLASPWLLGFSQIAPFVWNALIVGLLVLALTAGAVLYVRYHREYGA